MSEARLVRRARFRAHHHYRRAGWSAERNVAVFGARTEPHAHDWVVEVRVVGPIDPETGFCADLTALDAVLEGLRLGWHGGDLNLLIPEVASGAMVPTTEALARWLFERVGPAIEPPGRLEAVAVFESPDLGSEYPASGGGQ